jgi:hypothetical protein
MRRHANTSPHAHCLRGARRRRAAGGSIRVDLPSVPKSTFRQKTVVIRYAGSTNDSGISYRWSTTFTLKRIKLKP